MKTKVKLTFILAALALLAAACGNLEQPPVEAEAENTVLFPADPNKGLALVTVSGAAPAESGAARLLTPDLEGASYGYMLFAATTDLEGRDFGLPFNPASATPVELDPARWTITVRAFEGGVPSNPEEAAPAFEGAASLTLGPGETARLAIGLVPAGGGPGTFSYSINYPYFDYGDADSTKYPANISYGFLSVYPLGTEEPVKVIDLWSGAVDAGGGAKKTEGAVELPQGCYRIVTEIACKGVFPPDPQYILTYYSAQMYADTPETLVVYQGKTSAYSAVVEAENFSPIVPYQTSTLPHGMGTVHNDGQRTFGMDAIWGIGSLRVEGFLNKLPLNTRDTPYRIALIGDMAKLGTGDDPLFDLFAVLQGRYVSWDLSACTGTAIGDTTAAAVNRRGNRDRLVSILLPSTITTIGDYAFFDCPSLTYIPLPAGLTSIGDYAFAQPVGLGSGGLIHITLPTTLTSLGEGIFSLCKLLETADVPAGISAFEKDTFYYTQSLKTLVLRADSVVTLDGSRYRTLFLDEDGGVIYVPQSQLAAYQAAADTAGSWKTINDAWRLWWDREDGYIFQAIEDMP